MKANDEDRIPAGGIERPRGRVAVGCVGALMVVGIPVMAAFWVVSLASGEYQVGALGPAGLVFLVTLVATSGIAIVTVSARRQALRRTSAVAVAGLLVVGAASVATFFTRNDAPNGSAYDENYRQAAERVTIEVETALEQIVPGQWTAWEAVQFSPSDLECVDGFGRTRGASSGLAVWYLEGELTSSQLAALRQQLASERTEVLVQRRSDGFGGRSEDFPFSIVLREDELYGVDVWRLDADLPCLRLR